LRFDDSLDSAGGHQSANTAIDHHGFPQGVEMITINAKIGLGSSEESRFMLEGDDHVL
jgi:hypothetical protein